MATKNETKKEQEQKKSAPRGEKVSTSFKNTIKAYLDKRAAEDALFAQTYAKENKNLDECCNYILQEVKKSGCCGFDDDEIYNMAIHYYDEDDIKDVKPVAAAKIVVNHTVELSDEEKEEEERKREEKERKAKEERIRKQREAEERQKSLQLSLFDMM